MVGSEGGFKGVTLLFIVALNMFTTPQNGPTNDQKWLGKKSKSLQNILYSCLGICVLGLDIKWSITDDIGSYR